MNARANPHVVVVGAGLAGLSCAISCADHGAQVTVLEARPRVGGATWSFERNGLVFDNGQHVFLRCCTAYREFLARIGSTDNAPLQEHLALPVIEPSADGGVPRVAWIKAHRLPAPLHLMPSLLTYRFLSIGDRMKLGRAVRALQRVSLDDPVLDEMSFGDFLERHGQSASALAALWDIITLPTINLHVGEASLALAAKVFKTGLLSDRSAADIGWAQVPLSELHGDRAIRVLRESGAIVRERAKVSAIETVERMSLETAEVPGSNPTSARVVQGVVVDGEHIDADAVVLAVPHEQAADLLPAGGSLDPEAFRALGRSPIIDVHIVYGQKVMDFALAASVNSPVQYVFDRTAASGLGEGDGQCLAVSISNADAEHGERKDDLIDRYTTALGELFPKARDARILDAVVSREHVATFRGVPGSARLRPSSATGIANLYLAGAWLNTGWPATMEGAVRSGLAAAAGVLGAFGRAGDTSAREVEEVVA